MKEKDEEERREKETGGDKIILSQDKSSHRGRSFKEQETLSWERAINLFPHLQRKIQSLIQNTPKLSAPNPLQVSEARRLLGWHANFQATVPLNCLDACRVAMVICAQGCNVNR